MTAADVEVIAPLLLALDAPMSCRATCGEDYRREGQSPGRGSPFAGRLVEVARPRWRE